MDREIKRQFVFDVARKLGWQAFNHGNGSNNNFVYCAKGEAFFCVKLSGYALPNHQVEIFGSWPKCKIPNNHGYLYRPKKSRSINCSAKKSVDVAARDIKKRFVDWFEEAHAERLADRDKRYADWQEYERSLGAIAEAVDASKIERRSSVRATYAASNEVVRRGTLAILKNYSRGWTVAVDELTAEEAMKIGQLINDVIGERKK